MSAPAEAAAADPEVVYEDEDDDDDEAPAPLDKSPSSPSAGSTSSTGSDRGRAFSLGIRVKKSLSSKFTATKIGRKLITQLYGEDGEKVFGAIREANKLFYGDETAKAFEKNTISLLVKLKILSDDHILTVENTSSLQDPMFKFLFQFVEDLGSKGKVNIIPLSKSLLSLISLCEGIIKPFITPKNLTKFSTTLKKLADPGFLGAVMNDDAYSTLKKTMSTHLQILVGLLRVPDVFSSAMCRSASCDKPAVASVGFFKGSGYCVAHHIAFFKPIFDAPTIHRFIVDERASVFFVDFLNAHSEETKSESMLHYFHFVSASNEFVTTTNKNSRLRIAKNLVKKFFAPGAPMELGLPAPLKASIRDGIESKSEEDTRLPTDLFQEAVVLSQNALEEVFSKSFLSSVHWGRFKATYTVPEHIVAEFKEILAYNPTKERERKIDEKKE